MGRKTAILKELIILKRMLLKFLTHMLYILTPLNPLPMSPTDLKESLMLMSIYFVLWSIDIKPEPFVWQIFRAIHRSLVGSPVDTQLTMVSPLLPESINS